MFHAPTRRRPRLAGECASFAPRRCRFVRQIAASVNVRPLEERSPRIASRLPRRRHRGRLRPLRTIQPRAGKCALYEGRRIGSNLDALVPSAPSIAAVSDGRGIVEPSMSRATRSAFKPVMLASEAFGNFLNTVHAIRRSSRPPTTEQIQPKGEKLHVRRLVVKSRRKGRPLGRRPTTPNSLRRWSKMQTLAMRSTSQTIVNHGRITVGTDNHASFQRFHGSFAGCTRSAIRRRRFPPEPPFHRSSCRAQVARDARWPRTRRRLLRQSLLRSRQKASMYQHRRSLPGLRRSAYHAMASATEG